MNWNRWIRQIHRWFSVAVTLAMIVNLVAVLEGKYNNKLGLLAVAPFIVLFFTGLYLFVLPYATKWRRRAAEWRG
ncbi:MAG TPA: hypothetical protein VGS02_18320 [Acidobacteriaceae bacterium]|nr:hypothetical protein [Acidobacteriaceae bacterium]